MPKPSAPAVKLSAAEPGKIEIKTSPGQLCLVRLYGLDHVMVSNVANVKNFNIVFRIS